MDIRQQFDSIDLECIQRYVAEHEEENVNLDFKTVSRAEMAKDDRANYAKALSGFANSIGGLIIWGVDARKNDDGVDCAQVLKLIDNLPLFMSRLNDLEGQMVTPLVEGVCHKEVRANQGSQQGYAVSLIPESDSGPHMAKGGEDRYYKRSGSSLYRMEHFDLEDMFGRRQKPSLRLNHRVIGESTISFGSNLTREGAVILGIENTGRGLARFPYLALHSVGTRAGTCLKGLRGSRDFGIPLVPRVSDSKGWAFGAGLEVVIHPGTVLEVARICFSFGDQAKTYPDIEVEYSVGAQGARLRQGKVVVEGSELLRCVREGGR